MRTKQTIAIVALASMPNLTTTRAVSKRDMAACNQAADRVVYAPNRQNNQTAAIVGSAIGGGLIGLVTAAAVTSHDNNVTEANSRNACLSRKGYKMVPKKGE